MIDPLLPSSPASDEQPLSTLVVPSENAGTRIDQYLVAHVGDVSRAGIQQLLRDHRILLDGKPAKASLRLRGGETIIVLRAMIAPQAGTMAEDLPIDVVFEDSDLAVINKAAGMTVHLGAGAARSGTLVNALLHHFKGLSTVGGIVRPGIVHRLDKDTSGLMVVAKNDVAHRHLAAQFAGRVVKKRYVALVHGWLRKDEGTIKLAISRDRIRRIRMTTRGVGGRDAVSHYKVLRRIGSEYGHFSLVEVKIDTGRTHQIRVHLSALGHPVVGDTIYGAPRTVAPPAAPEPRKRKPTRKPKSGEGSPNVKSNAIGLDRNFLHAQAISFLHPRTDKELDFEQTLPDELRGFLDRIEGSAAAAGKP